MTIYNVLDQCSQQLRKGDEVSTGNLGEGLEHIKAITIDLNPHVSEMAGKPGIEIVDLELLSVGVNKVEAEAVRPELRKLVDETFDVARLKQGPSYIEIGYNLGDQGYAFQLMAVGQVLGWWQVVTPTTTLHVTDPKLALDMAGAGGVWINGYHPDGEVR